MTDAQLTALCLQQNRQAQKRLYDLYADTMLGLCYRYTKSLADAEDVLQEGFVKVFTNLKQYKGKGDLGGWIRRIMVNTSINYLRQHSRYRNELLQDPPALHPVGQESPEITIDTKDLIELIRELPLGYQTIFNLVAIEGYNHIEVAELLQISEHTSRSQYSRARAVLIKLLHQAAKTAMPMNHAK